jgi:sarcosine oxidase subunit gamma
VTVAEQPDVALASLAERAGGAERVASLAQDLTGHPPPGPRHIGGSPGGMQLMWTGPGQWLVLAPFATFETLAETLAARLTGAASVTEQTDGWVCIALTGPGSIAVLERSCALDTARMTAGMADRTGLDHMNVFVICDQPGEAYRILGARSSALSLFEALETVAKGQS